MKKSVMIQILSLESWKGTFALEGSHLSVPHRFTRYWEPREINRACKLYKPRTQSMQNVPSVTAHINAKSDICNQPQFYAPTYDMEEGWRRFA